jgi:hypothetical protein
MQKDFARRGLPPPDEATVRGRYLGEGVHAPNLATVKDFARFLAAASNGKITELPTGDITCSQQKKKA